MAAIGLCITYHLTRDTTALGSSRCNGRDYH
jgi:hypothetical protein